MSARVFLQCGALVEEVVKIEIPRLTIQTVNQGEASPDKGNTLGQHWAH